MALLALAFGIISIPAAIAQTATTPNPSTSISTPPPPVPAPAPTGKHGAHGAEAVLTPAELAHFNQVRSQVLAANTTLAAEGANLKAQKKAAKNSTDPDTAKAALKAQKKDYEQKLEIAMMKADPTVQPLFAKIKAAKKEKKNAPATA